MNCKEIRRRLTSELVEKFGQYSEKGSYNPKEDQMAKDYHRFGAVKNYLEHQKKISRDDIIRSDKELIRLDKEMFRDWRIQRALGHVVENFLVGYQQTNYLFYGVDYLLRERKEDLSEEIVKELERIQLISNNDKVALEILESGSSRMKEVYNSVNNVFAELGDYRPRVEEEMDPRVYCHNGSFKIRGDGSEFIRSFNDVSAQQREALVAGLVEHKTVGAFELDMYNGLVDTLGQLEAISFHNTPTRNGIASFMYQSGGLLHGNSNDVGAVVVSLDAHHVGHVARFYTISDRQMMLGESRVDPEILGNNFKQNFINLFLDKGLEISKVDEHCGGVVATTSNGYITELRIGNLPKFNTPTPKPWNDWNREGQWRSPEELAKNKKYGLKVV
jgi:hypothetical protein